MTKEEYDRARDFLETVESLLETWREMAGKATGAARRMETIHAAREIARAGRKYGGESDGGGVQV